MPPQTFILLVSIFVLVVLFIILFYKNGLEGYQNTAYPGTKLFYNSPAYGSLQKYEGPKADYPNGQQTASLDSSGSQLFSYQLYQQGVNAATPTKEQLDSISGQSYEQTGYGAEVLGGGLSPNTAPYALLKDNNKIESEFQAVNYGSERAQSISACAQNAPTFVATSLLPKPVIPGQESWDIGVPKNILANNNYLSPSQQIGTDTTLGSTRNQSWDIRNTIPNAMVVVSPWNNTDILPDLERRPLDCFIPSDQGIYGCGSTGCNANKTF